MVKLDLKCQCSNCGKEYAMFGFSTHAPIPLVKKLIKDIGLHEQMPVAIRETGKDKWEEIK